MRTRYAILFAISLFTLFTFGPSGAAHANAASRVVRVELRAEAAPAMTRCPATVEFRGLIKMDGPGIVKYTFERSDGATAPVYTLHFSEAGAQDVSTTWRLGRSYSGYQKLKVLAPNEVLSAEARFDLNCGGTPTIPMMPPAVSAINVSCPIEMARTEMVSPLPEGWWQTPQIGRLVSLGVQRIGGEQTLVCRYGAYGAQVSVMRRFPEGMSNCRVTGTNTFSCSSE